MAKWNPKFKIKLIDIFNKTYADRPQEFRDLLRPVLSDDQFKEFYGQSAIDKIVERTVDKRIDKHGKEFLAYKKSYRDSMDFKIYGKRAGRANLRLSGVMLASMVNKDRGFNIVIQFVDSEEAGKAQGHISGNLGKYTKGRKRDFFGLPDKDLIAIMRESVRLFREESLELLSEREIPSPDFSVEGDASAANLLLLDEVGFDVG